MNCTCNCGDLLKVGYRLCIKCKIQKINAECYNSASTIKCILTNKCGPCQAIHISEIKHSENQKIERRLLKQRNVLEKASGITEKQKNFDVPEKVFYLDNKTPTSSIKSTSSTDIESVEKYEKKNLDENISKKRKIDDKKKVLLDSEDEEEEDDDDEEEEEEKEEDDDEKENIKIKGLKQLPLKFIVNKRLIELKKQNIELLDGNNLFDFVIFGSSSANIKSSKHLKVEYQKILDYIATGAVNVSKARLDLSTLKLNMIEQYFFAFVDVEYIKKKSLAAMVNNIILQLCIGLEEVYGYARNEDKNKFRKQYKRWGNIFSIKLSMHFGWLPQTLLEQIEKQNTKPSNYRTYQEEMDEDLKSLLSNSSTLFNNITDLLEDVCTDVSFFNTYRIASFVEVIECNNSYDKRGNKLNYRLENVAGNQPGAEAIVKYKIDQQTKKEIAKAKIENKKKLMKASVSAPQPINSTPHHTKFSPAVMTASTVKSKSITSFYPQVIIKPKETVNTTNLLSPSCFIEEDNEDNGQSADQLWSKLENLFDISSNMLLQSLHSTVMESPSTNNETYGTKLILNVEELQHNSTMLSKLIQCLEMKGSNNSENLKTDLEDLLKSDGFSFIYLKITPPVKKTPNYQNFINPNGYCFYQSIFLVFVAHILCLNDNDKKETSEAISNKYSEERQQTIRKYTYCQKSPLFDESCDDEDLNQSRMKFKNFWIRIKNFIENEPDIINTLKIQHIFLGPLQNSNDKDDLVNTLINGITGVVDSLETKSSTSDGFKDLDKKYWLSKECAILLTMIIYKIDYPEKFQIVKNSFSIDMYTEYDVESNNLTDDYNHIIHNSCAFSDIIPSNTMSCCILNFSSRMEDYDEVAVAKSLHSYRELSKIFMDQYKRLVFTGGNHITVLPSAENRIAPVKSERSTLKRLISNMAEALLINVKSPIVIEKYYISATPLSPSKTQTAYSLAMRRMKRQNKIVCSSPMITDPDQPSCFRDILNFLNSPSVENYINKRFAEITEEISVFIDENEEIWNTIQDEALYKIVGGPTTCQVRKVEIEALMKQSDQQMTFTSTLNLVANIINVDSNQQVDTCQLFVFDFSISNTIWSSSEDTITQDQITNIHPIQLIQLRIKLAKVIMVPFVEAKHFSLMVLIPSLKKGFWLDSLCSYIAAARKIEVLRKMILYCNLKIGKSATSIDKWEIHIDGVNGSDTLEQQGGTLHCGVFVKSYLLSIAFTHDINEVIKNFSDKTYHSMFRDINVSNMLMRRKMITTVLHDRKTYLLATIKG